MTSIIVTFTDGTTHTFSNVEKFSWLEGSRAYKIVCKSIGVIEDYYEINHIQIGCVKMLQHYEPYKEPVK